MSETTREERDNLRKIIELLPSKELDDEGHTQWNHMLERMARRLCDQVDALEAERERQTKLNAAQHLKNSGLHRRAQAAESAARSLLKAMRATRVQDGCWRYHSSRCECVPCRLWREKEQLEAEVARLKAGRFTPEEIHNFCHGLDATVPVEEFAVGCRNEMLRLYGRCPFDRDAADSKDAQ